MSITNTEGTIPSDYYHQLLELKQSISFKISFIKGLAEVAEKMMKNPEFKGTHSEWAEAKIYTGPAEKNIEELNSLFEKFCEISNEHNYYWHFCSPKVYISHFEGFKQNYLKLIPDSEINEFYEHELNSLLQDQTDKESFYKKIEQEDLLLTVDYYEYLSEKNKTIINHNNKRKGKHVLAAILKDNCELIEGKNKRFQVYQKTSSSNQQQVSEKTTSEIKTEFFKNHLNIFKSNESAELYKYLDKHYIDSFEKTKYIDIYRYLNSHPWHIICTQNQFLEFIKSTKGIDISKITPETYKYKEKTLTKLKNLNELFLENFQNLDKE